MKKVYLLLVLAAFLFAGCGGSGVKVNTELIPVKNAEKWGYVDLTGKWVINPQFDYADYFVDGIAVIRNAEGKYGYINEKGEFVITPQYKYANPFSEGLAVVVSEGGAPKYIDTKGEIKFELATAQEAGSFHDGLAMVKDAEGKWGFVDKEGNMKINYQFDMVLDFTEGLAAVMKQKTKDSVTFEQEWGYINKEGEMVINLQYKSASMFFNGMAVVSSDLKTWGYINTKGEFVINPQYDYAQPFGKTLAAVKQGETWGFIDKEGKFVVNPQFDNTRGCIGKLFAIRSAEKWGYVDETGKIIINAQFDKASAFIGEMAIVKTNDKYGFIDATGKYLVNPQFEDVNDNGAHYANLGVYADVVPTDKITPPETVATEFLKLLGEKKWDEAKKLGTSTTATTLDFKKSNAEEEGDTTATAPKIENMKCTITGESAVCTYTEDGEAQEINLKKENNKWLVDLPKETGGENIDFNLN